MFTFEWLSGCAADNMIKTFRENHINWCRDKYFRLCADIDRTGEAVPVDYKHLAGNTFAIVKK